MPYTLGCCFFGQPPQMEEGHRELPAGVSMITRPAVTGPGLAPRYRGHSATEEGSYISFGELSLSSIHPAVWAGLAAVAGLGVYLTYRKRKTGLSGLLIKADGTEVEYSPAKKKFTLEELQRAVGGYIEQVPVRIGGRRKMWADEEGLVKGKPINRKATQMAREGGYAWETPIVGDVLITFPGEGI